MPAFTGWGYSHLPSTTIWLLAGYRVGSVTDPSPNKGGSAPPDRATPGRHQQHPGTPGCTKYRKKLDTKSPGTLPTSLAVNAFIEQLWYIPGKM